MAGAMQRETVSDVTLKGSWTTLTLLTVAYVFSFIDRMAVSVIVEPMRLDLGLSDIQIGLLQGAAFSVFYAVFGLPLGRLADLYNRRLIIIVGLCLWSLATAVSGLASGFALLFLARCLVGVGEASLSPSALSMFADMFSSKKLGRAVGIYTAGSIFGAGIALLVGGAIYSYYASFEALRAPFLGEIEAWQATFFAIGLPGLLLAVAIYVFIDEPPRRKREEATPLKSVIRYLIDNWRDFLPLLALYTLPSCLGYAFFGWTVPYLVRSFGLEPGTAGALFGGVMLTAGVAGPIASGFVADFVQTRYRSITVFHVLGIFYVLGIVGGIGAYLPLPLPVAMAFMAILAFGFTSTFALPMLQLQRRSPARMRGLVTAITLMSGALCGMSLGPLLVPIVSGALFDGMLGPAISTVIVFCSLSAIGLIAMLIFGGKGGPSSASISAGSSQA